LFQFLKQVWILLHKLETDTPNYLGVESRMENGPGIFNLAASNGAEKVSLIGVVEADD